MKNKLRILNIDLQVFFFRCACYMMIIDRIHEVSKKDMETFDRYLTIMATKTLIRINK